jgi:hypothetical protein
LSPFESLPLGDARGDHPHAPHRRGAARIDEVHRATQGAGHVLLKLEAFVRRVVSMMGRVLCGLRRWFGRGGREVAGGLPS